MREESGPVSHSAVGLPGSQAAGGRIIRQPAYVLMFSASVLSTLFSGHADALYLPVAPDRFLLAGALVLLVLDRDAWRGIRLRVRPVHVAMALLVVLAGLSVATTGSLTDTTSAIALLDRILVPFLLFSLAPVVYRTRERRLVLVKGLVVVGLYLALTAVAERFAPGLVWPSYITDPNVGGQFGRARGPFATSVPNGILLGIGGFAALAGARLMQGAWRNVCLLTAPLCALGTLLTLTRSVWLGTAVGLLLALATARSLRPLLPIAVLLGALGVALAFVLLPGLQDDAEERTGADRSVYDRRNTNSAALRIVQQRPLTGVGWNRFLDVSRDWVRQADDYPLTSVDIEVHNVLLARSAELGIPGGALWIATFVGTMGHACLRRRYSSLTGRSTKEDETWRFLMVGSTMCWLAPAMLTPLAQPMPNQVIYVLAGALLSDYLLERRPYAGSRTILPGSR